MLPDEDPQDARPRSGDDPFTELGLTQEQFAEIALSGPLEWNAEQLDFLQSLLVGDPVDPEIARELVEDFLRHTPEPEPLTPPRAREPDIPRELMDPEELAEEMAGTFEPVAFQALPAFDVPTSNVNLDDWLKKKS